MKILKTMAASAALAACTAATVDAQEWVYGARSVTMVPGSGDQIEIRLAGTCNSRRGWRVALAAYLRGVYNDGIGPFSTTMIGNSVACRGAEGTYTATVSVHRSTIWGLEKLRLEAKGAWSVNALTAVGVTSTDDDLDGWLVPLETRVVW